MLTLAELSIVWLIIRSNNIFNIELYGGFSLRIVVSQDLKSNKATILDFKLLTCAFISWYHRKIMFESWNTPLTHSFKFLQSYNILPYFVYRHVILSHSTEAGVHDKRMLLNHDIFFAGNLAINVEWSLTRRWCNVKESSTRFMGD